MNSGVVCLLVLLFVVCCVCVVTPPLSTRGRDIVDAHGTKVKLSCVNWYGSDQLDFVVGGLQAQNLSFISNLIKQLGFNCVRLPFSLELVMSNPILRNLTVISKEPRFLNQRAMTVFQQVVTSLTNNQIMVILDNHVSDANWCCSSSDGDGLWWNARYSTEDWINTWTKLAQEFTNNKFVIGADLRNELRQTTINDKTYSPVWGGNDHLTNWPAAAERAGNAILKVNPNFLIFVEGINYALDLTGVEHRPIKLDHNNRLVYSAHNYYWSYNVRSVQQLWSVLDSSWGYILHQQIAPVWLGEFGTCHTTINCVQSTEWGIGLWWEGLMQYFKRNDIDWGYWAIDGTESTGKGRKWGTPESYGILNLEWNKVALDQMYQDLKKNF